MRQQTIFNTDGERREYDPDLDDVPPPTGPSDEALSKIEDFGKLGLVDRTNVD
jgi:hypothetical protein